MMKHMLPANTQAVHLTAHLHPLLHTHLVREDPEAPVRFPTHSLSSLFLQVLAKEAEKYITPKQVS